MKEHHQTKYLGPPNSMIYVIEGLQIQNLYSSLAVKASPRISSQVFCFICLRITGT